MLGTVPVHQPISPAVAHLFASTLPQLPALQTQLLQRSIRPEFQGTIPLLMVSLHLLTLSAHAQWGLL